MYDAVVLRIAGALALALAPMIVLGSPASAQRIGALRASGVTSVGIDREIVEVRCTQGETDDALDCEVEVTYELSHDGDEATAPSIIVSADGMEGTVEVDGVALGREAPTLRPLSVGVPAGRTTRLTIRARMSLARVGGSDPTGDLFQARDALSARHPLLVAPWNGVERRFRYARPIAMHWHHVGALRIHVEVPAPWRVGGNGVREPAHGEGVYEATAESMSAVDLTLMRGGSRDDVRIGGPYVGLGGEVLRGDFRLRAGWEIGITEWAIVGVSFETNGRDLALITPQVEIASWSLILAPSLAIAAGVPVRFGNRTGPTAGLRLEASATFFSVAFVSSFDYYPALSEWDIVLMGRIGL